MRGYTRKPGTNLYKILTDTYTQPCRYLYVTWFSYAVLIDSCYSRLSVCNQTCMTQPIYYLTEVDENILWALGRFHYLTAAQANRLLYPNNSDENRYAQRLFKRLVDAGYVLRLRALPRPLIGRESHVFALAWKGREYVREMGISIESYFRPSDEKRVAQNSPFMLHRLAAIDVLLTAERLCWDFPEIWCPEMFTERELKRGALRVEVPPIRRSTGNGPRKVAVIPDGFFQLSINESPPVSIALELDRATEDQKVWRQKVAAYTVWAAGPYKKAFETDNLTIAVVCPTEQRRTLLMDWTMRELQAREVQTFAQLFLFTPTSPAAVSPARFVFGRVWHQADSMTPVPLIDLTAFGTAEKGVVYRAT
jgi:Replication-relaxation